MYITLNRKKILYLMLILSGCILGAFDFPYLFWAVGLIIIFSDILIVVRQKDGIKYKQFAFFESVFIAIIMPNNYFVLLVLLVNYFTVIKKNYKASKLELIFIVILIGNIFINFVPIPNIIFSIFFWMPFFLAYRFFCYYLDFDFSLIYTNSQYLYLIKTIAITEFASVICSFINRENYDYVDLDWVSGTFGYMQGMELTITMFFLFTMFILCFMKTNKLSYIGYAMVCIISGTLTGCIGITMVFAAAILVFILIEPLIKVKYKIAILIAILFLSGITIISNKEWVINDILNLTDFEYLQQRISKLNMYVTTFSTIPSLSMVFTLFGTGMGLFSSRAAMACTGSYINIYNYFFEQPSMSDYTYKYIYPWITSGYQGGTSAAPYSQVITIFGEFGILGCIFFIYFFIKLWRKSKNLQKFMLIYLIGLMFYENILEYGRCMIAFWMIYSILEEVSNNKKFSMKLFLGEIYENK